MKEIAEVRHMAMLYTYYVSNQETLIFCKSKHGFKRMEAFPNTLVVLLVLLPNRPLRLSNFAMDLISYSSDLLQAVEN